VCLSGGISKSVADRQIWDKYCETPGKIEDGSHVNKTCAHLDNYKEDVAREYRSTT
jgi:hypothetical protein